MIMTIQSTDAVIFLNGQRARIWRGTTGGGIPVLCLVNELSGDATFDEIERNGAAPPPEIQSFAIRFAPALARFWR